MGGEKPGGLQELASDVLAGGEVAWQRFVGRVHPMAVAIARRKNRSEDSCHACALRALETIQANDCAALRRYFEVRERYPSLEFEAWLSTIVSHAAIDELRSHPEVQRRRKSDGKRALETVILEPIDPGTVARRGLAVEDAVELRRVLSLIAGSDFPTEQRRALSLWLDGYRAAEIADELDLDTAQANRLLRAARQRLRRLHLGETP